MLSSTDLSALVTVLAGTMGGLIGAREANAGVVTTLLFALGSLLVSLTLARAFDKLQCVIFRSKKLHDGVQLALSITICTLSPFLACLGMTGLSILSAGHIL